MAQFALSWDAYKQNICSGLSALQQNGEFVDMTLAADGHHVKVHQMVMSLVSPYIKELISSAQCTHPVIFLNKISYVTLCSILEYVYSGEVQVSKDNIHDLVDAAQQLHIKGLQEMKLELSTQPTTSQAATTHEEGQPLSLMQTNRRSRVGHLEDFAASKEEDLHDFSSPKYTPDLPMLDTTDDEMPLIEQRELNTKQVAALPKASRTNSMLSSNSNVKVKDAQIQFTVSNQGNLQIILNRFVYYLKYTSRRGPGASGHRLWRCVDNSRKPKCPANVLTQDNLVIKRAGAHNHPFHDTMILKKVQRVGVFSAVEQAEHHGETLKQQHLEATQGETIKQPNRNGTKQAGDETE